MGATVGGIQVGEHLTIPLEAPFSAARYLEAIEAAEDAGVEFLIIDSLSHAWSGEGGLLDMQANIAKRSGNSYTAWRDVTQLHNRLVDKILQCPMHVAATLRTKTEYVIEDNGNGKKSPRKVGMAPVFREGLEYEFSVFFELAQDHSAVATKDRTGLFDGQYFVVTPETGSRIAGWLGGTADKRPLSPSHNETLSWEERVDQLLKARCTGLAPEQKAQVASRLKEIAGTANYRTITDEATLMAIYNAFKEESV